MFMLMNSSKTISVDEVFDTISIGYYIENSIPKPTFMECLADLLKDSNKLESATNSAIIDFANDYERYAQEKRLLIDTLPKEAISFIIPLDFYLPIPERYYASTYDNGCLIHASVYHNEIQIGRNKIRISFIIVTICNKEAKKIAKTFRKNKHLIIDKTYDMAINEVNRIIRSFLALTKRHNHYIHEVTRVQLSSVINIVLFRRDSKKAIGRSLLFTHRAPIHDCLSIGLLNDEELSEFNNYHWNTGITNNNILKLLSKLNDAVNARCLGKDSESILLIESFVEYSLGFFYCECMRIENPDKTIEKCVKQYMTECRKRGFSAERRIATILGYKSKEDYELLKEKINKKDFIKSCKDIRNALTHNFFSIKAEACDSEKAIKSAAYYISSIAKEILGQSTDRSTIEQLKVLITATEIVLR